MKTCPSCPSCGDELCVWTVVEFNVVQLMPASGLVGLVVNEDGTIDKCPLVALAVAKRTKTEHAGHTYNDSNKKCQYHAVGESCRLDNDIVAIGLLGGYTQIMEEFSNFGGICKEDDNPYECLGKLLWHKNTEFAKAALEKKLCDPTLIARLEKE